MRRKLRRPCPMWTPPSGPSSGGGLVLGQGGTAHAQRATVPTEAQIGKAIADLETWSGLIQAGFSGSRGTHPAGDPRRVRRCRAGVRGHRWPVAAVSPLQRRGGRRAAGGALVRRARRGGPAPAAVHQGPPRLANRTRSCGAASPRAVPSLLFMQSEARCRPDGAMRGASTRHR